ncbi:iron-siderophore ABC transporter substrate-binding protein [Gracilibacillus caseinilyticus]|uniref:Iron-siderophore ABC transporter substrate-binding protein n=1 Tax=Gracilibacillus caseinilyticus TaxID=2932256 RepID=A0ABY4F5F4_9BACI|nr:iron-siderophore ABC transporter substrate-binding protein [Gracilibacillus caseinilyticus]UOQ49691.1 iron-siderophore ABC transporter substrate-binding protein [Gracilibacillus caseinilyticus]
MKRKLALSSLLLFTLMMFLLIGCSSDNEETANSDDNTANADETETESNDTEEAASEYPIVIEHAFGETVIEEKPERVATIQWANHDVALALGVVPVGFSAANYGVQDDSGLLPWTKEKLDELGAEDPNVFQDTDGLDFEAIADTNPDVILAAYSGITQEDYYILSEIAPVVAYESGPWVTTWREQVLLNAKGLGMEEEGEQLIADTEQLIQEKASEYPKTDGKKVVWVNFSADDMSQLHLYTPTDPRGGFLIELGMEYPESVTNQIEDESSYSLKLSAENADVLNDADIIIGYGGEDLYEAIKADPLLGKILAIERGSVVFIGNGTPLAASGNPNPLSIEYTIDQYLELIGEAISKIDE